MLHYKAHNALGEKFVLGYTFHTTEVKNVPYKAPVISHILLPHTTNI